MRQGKSDRHACVRQMVQLLILAGFLWPGGACMRGASGPAGDTGARAEATGLGSSEAGVARHGAPTELCFLCDPSLREEGRLWCGEHERYEDRCWLCHPELRAEGRAYCEAHGLYGDECFLCRPALRGVARKVSVGGSGSLMCGEHRVPEAECGICRPEALRGMKVGESLKVRMPAQDSASLAGVRWSPAESGVVLQEIDCVGELEFDPGRRVRVVAPVEGVVREVLVDWGGRVAAGQVVVRLWSAEMQEAVAEAVLRYQALERERRLRELRVNSERELEEAEAAHRAACQRAQNFGFTESEIHSWVRRPDPSVYLEVRAPLSGEVLERGAVAGGRVRAGDELLTVVDASVLRAWLYVPEEEAGRIRPGQRVELLGGGRFEPVGEGRVMWVSPAVDERTRLVRVLAEVENAGGQLRARMFVRARIRVGEEAGVRLPGSAVQRVEGRPVVFVRREADLFEARVVELGARSDGWCQVTRGLAEGEPVVVEGSFVLKSQLLVSRLGEACVDE
ncbi:MAG: hypothetical protein KatS3mg132_561 [Limisphaera sp.]|nr:MAG: hypothetical protein KatS3mg132_561 [Limisphaera sp.]